MDAVNLSRLPLSNDPAQVLAQCPASVCGLPNGRLYAQGLGLALIGVLAQRATVASVAAPRAARLATSQQRRVVELIEQQLARRRFGVPPRLLRQRG